MSLENMWIGFFCRPERSSFGHIGVEQVDERLGWMVVEGDVEDRRTKHEAEHGAGVW